MGRTKGKKPKRRKRKPDVIDRRRSGMQRAHKTGRTTIIPSIPLFGGRGPSVGRELHYLRKFSLPELTNFQDFFQSVSGKKAYAQAVKEKKSGTRPSSIYWKNITTRHTVKLVGPTGARHYETGSGRLITFGSQDRREAQAFLEQRRKGRSLPKRHPSKYFLEKHVAGNEWRTIKSSRSLVPIDKHMVKHGLIGNKQYRVRKYYKAPPQRL